MSMRLFRTLEDSFPPQKQTTCGARKTNGAERAARTAAHARVVVVVVVRERRKGSAALLLPLPDSVLRGDERRVDVRGVHAKHGVVP